MRTFILSTPTARSNCLNYIGHCPDGMAVEIHEVKARRSIQANRRHWALMNQISEEAWIEGRQYSPEVWHEFFCRRFIGVIDLPGGTSMAESSSILNSKEFSEFDQKIEVYMSTELGLIPIEVIEPIGRTI